MSEAAGNRQQATVRRLRLLEAAGDRPFLDIMRAETPLEATRKFLDEVQRMDEEAQRRVIALAHELRREIVVRMASAKNYEAYRLPQLERELALVMDDWRQKYNREQFDLFKDYAALGQAQVAGPVEAAGFHIQMPAMSVKLLDTAQRFSADLVREVTDDVIADITHEIRLAAFGVETPFDAMKKVEAMIDDPLTFRSIAHRAETIVRTEGGRIQSMAAQARMEDAAAIVPGLQKQWLWSGVSRLQHAAINGQVRDVDKPFDLPGARYCAPDKLMFPRDPAGLACQTINCGCQSLPYKKEWELEKVAA